MAYRDVVLLDKPTLCWPLDDSTPPINIVQTASGHNTNTTAGGPFTVSVTLGSTPNAANQLIAIIGSLGPTTSVAVNHLSWTTDKDETTDVASVVVLRVVSDGSTTSFTFTCTQSTGYSADIWVYLMEVGGLQSSPVDQSASGGSSGTSTGTVSLTANAHSNELVIYAVAAEASTQPTAPTFTGSITSAFTGDTGSAATYQTSLFVGTYYNQRGGRYTPSSSVGWTTSANYGYVAISYKGAQSKARDISGNNLNGTPQYGGLDFDGGSLVPGFPGGAAFTGTLNDGMVINASALNCGTGDVTMELWVILTGSTASYRDLMGRTQIGQDNGVQVFTAVTTGYIVAYVYNQSAGISKRLSDGVPHHIVITRKSGEASLYLDGQLGTQWSASGNIETAGTPTLGVGYDPGAGNGAPIGRAAWACWYAGYALPASRVMAHYLAGMREGILVANPELERHRRGRR